MADIRSWSTTAASNNSAPPDGAPEGQAPSTLNNVIRENMRASKKQWSQAEWFSHGDDIATTTIRKDGQNISLSGTHTVTYHIGRRIRALDTVGTLYGTIEATTFSGGTQVTVVWDTGSLTATVTAVELSIFSQTNPSAPQLDQTVTSHDDGAGVAPTFTLYRNSGSPADADFGGRFAWDGNDSTGAQVTYGAIDIQFDDVTDTEVDSTMLLKTMVAGALTTQADISSVGAVFVPPISTTDATDTSSGSTGSIQTAGGIGAVKDIYSDASITAETALVSDTISERVAAAGVTVDGLLIKDTTITFADEALGNYDEGEWTPTIAGSGTAGTQTYTRNLGRYTRIGNLVMCSFEVIMSAFDGATSGSILIAGLPFTIENTSFIRYGLALSDARFANIDTAGGYSYLMGLGLENSTTIRMQEAGDNIATAALSEADLGNTSGFSGSIVFRI